MAAVLIFGLIATISNPSAQADWRADLGTFRVGIVGGNDPAAEMARVEPFRLALEDALGMNVEIFPGADFVSLIEAQIAGRIEYAVTSATAYGLAEAKCDCVEPLVIASDADKTSQTYAVLITRRAGPNSLEELKNKSIMFLSQTSLSDYAYPLQQLSQDEFVPAEQNVTIQSRQSPDQSLEDFSKGTGDALMGWSTLNGSLFDGYFSGTLRDLAAKAGKDANDYQIIWKSNPIPFRTHIIRKNLNTAAKEILRSLLANLYDQNPVAYDSIEPVHGGGFILASPSRFSALVDFGRQWMDSKLADTNEISAPIKKAPVE